MNAKVISREVFVPSGGQGNVTGGSYYMRAGGVELLSIHSRSTRSDLQDVATFRRSLDNGRTWSEPQEKPTIEQRPEGTWRSHVASVCADPKSGKLILFRTEGVLPSDDAMEGLRHYTVQYSISPDGDPGTSIFEPLVCRGDEFDVEHPLPGVQRGRNSFLIGDLSCVPIVLKDGTILLPLQITPVDENGELYNPSKGLKYRDSAVIRGTWSADGQLEWEASAPVKGDPQRTTRGVLEPTVAELPDGRILMVMRGSNDTWPPQDLGDPNRYLPGYKWCSFSSDGGRTWTGPQPWTDSNGKPFYSPSSCSQLVAHSSGRLFWCGNVLPHNPIGNLPRYPMVLAEVDVATGLVLPDSFTVVDDKGPEDEPTLQLSSFFAREDRETGHLLLHMPRNFALPPAPGESLNWNSDLWLYRISVDA